MDTRKLQFSVQGSVLQLVLFYGAYVITDSKYISYSSGDLTIRKNQRLGLGNRIRTNSEISYVGLSLYQGGRVLVLSNHYFRADLCVRKGILLAYTPGLAISQDRKDFWRISGHGTVFLQCKGHFIEKKLGKKETFYYSENALVGHTKDLQFSRANHRVLGKRNLATGPGTVILANDYWISEAVYEKEKYQIFIRLGGIALLVIVWAIFYLLIHSELI